MNLQELGFNGIGTLNTESAAQIVNNAFSTNEVVAYVGEEVDTVEIKTSVIERDPRLRLTVGFGSDRAEIESNGDIRELVPFTTESLHAIIGRLSVDGFMLLMEENHVNTHSVDSVFEFLNHRIGEFYEIVPYEFQNFLDIKEILHHEHMHDEDLENCVESEFYIFDGLEYQPLTDDLIHEITEDFYDNHIVNATIKGGVQYV